MFAPLLRKFRKSKAASPSTSRDLAAAQKLAAAAKPAVESLEERTLFSYAAPVPYAAGAAPVTVAVADFNNDGKADVVATNAGLDNNATVLLGNGDGTFGAPIVTPLGAAVPEAHISGAQAGTIATADFNADGKLDLAIVSGSNGLVLLGNGDGTFAAPTATVLGNSVSRISAADVNNDGAADLLAANTLGTASVLLSNGDGTFAPLRSYSAGGDAMDVKAADLNHDGNQDVLVANQLSAGTVTVLMGHGDGSFDGQRSYYAYSGPFRMVVADFDHDGNDDVAVANSYSSSYVSILHGNGDGSLILHGTYDAGGEPWELEAEDVDGDGYDDLISSNGVEYQVELNNHDGTLAPVSLFANSGRDFVAHDFNDDGAADLLGASAGSVAVQMNTTPATTNVSTAVGFRLTAPAATTIAGYQVPLTLEAVDADGNVVTDFAGVVHVTTTDRKAPSFTFVFTAADAGTHTFAAGAALYTTGAQTITAVGPVGLTGGLTLTVIPGQARKFTVTADASVVAGSAANVTFTATDAWNNLVSDYAGTVHFTSTDARAVLPADYTFTAEDAGTHTFAVTLKTATMQQVIATDSTSPGIVLGYSPTIRVMPAASSSLSITGGGGHIGSPHTVTLIAYDPYGNVANGYFGTVHLTASDPSLVLPAADVTLVNGYATVSVTPMTLGAQILTATDVADANMTARETIVGTPGDAVRVEVTSISDAVAGTVQALTITAYDAFGNVAVDYAGTVAFSSTDPLATMPFYTFTGADNGSHTFTVALKTAGTQSLTIRDTANPAIGSTQSGIVITPGVAVTLNVTRLRATVAGVAQAVTVSARDVYGNVATAYRGTVTFASSDTTAVLPATYTFTPADAGTKTFDVTLKNDGGQTFTVNDAANNWTSFQQDIQVVPAAFAGFAFKTSSNATLGQAYSFTVTVVDAFGNTITDYAGRVHFTGPTNSGSVMPADYTFTSADQGEHVFSATFGSEGTFTLTVNDTAAPTIKSSTSIVVKKASGGGGSGGGGGGGGSNSGKNR